MANRCIAAGCLFCILLLFTFEECTAANIKQPKQLSKRLLKLEEKLIQRSRQTEERIYRSGAVYNDPELNEYLDSIVQKVLPADFKDDKIDIKVKIIRDPTVNAFALPTGTVYLHTGLLARIENEAQLAFILGHELSHIVNKDGVYATKSLHSKAVTTKLCDLVIAPAAVFFGILGDLVRSGFGLLYVSSVTGYSKEQESRADRESVAFAVKAGYSAEEGPKIIDILMDERKRYKNASEIYFLMSHPSNKTRRKIIAGVIEEQYKNRTGDLVNRETYFRHITFLKSYNASLNIKMERFRHALDNVESVLAVRPDDAEAHFYAGEIYRKMASDRRSLKFELSKKEWKRITSDKKKEEQIAEWRKKSLAEYKRALDGDPGYSAPNRGIGLLYMDMGEYDKALDSFNRYLKLNAGAKDRRYVKSLIKTVNDRMKERIGKGTKGR